MSITRPDYLAARERLALLDDPPPKTYTSPPRPEDGMPHSHEVAHPRHGEWVSAVHSREQDLALVAAYEQAQASAS
jgi:hypothetical protein